MPKREPLYPHVPKSKQPQFPHMKGRQPSTMTLTLPPETKQAMLDLCRRAKDKIELGMVLSVVNNEVIAGPTKWGEPNHVLLEPPEGLEIPFGTFHTHPRENAPELSDADRMYLLLHDPCLFMGVGNPYHNYAQVSAKRKPAGPELKKRLEALAPVSVGISLVSLSLFLNTPKEIMDFLDVEGLPWLRRELEKAGGPIEGIAQYFRDYTIYLDDGKPSYIEVVSPGVLPEEQIRLFHSSLELMASTEGDPIRKFCCRICGECAPKELLEEGRFLDRISWLRQHYKEKHPGMWGKMSPMTVEDGEPVSPEYRHLTSLVDEPLPKDAY